MKKTKILGLFLTAALFLSSCGTTNTVPITGRKQRLLVSDEKVMSLSNQQYQQYMASAKASTNATNTAMVKRVGQKLANAVETYLKNNNLASEVQNYSWEFNLVQDNSANAFCMPGGKIVVYEGLLPYTQTEGALAIVLGHEIAHAVAKHSAERMSQQLKSQYGAQALSVLMGGVGLNSNIQNIANQVYGLGAQYGVMLPYSRKNESEADYMGLIFAAMAGYDPSVAVEFWQRMSQASSSQQSEFFSDHPSDATRISQIQKELPEALQIYNAVTGKSGSATTTTTSSKKSSSSKKTTTTPSTTKSIRIK